jgi:hypothetical protein
VFLQVHYRDARLSARIVKSMPRKTAMNSNWSYQPRAEKPPKWAATTLARAEAGRSIRTVAADKREKDSIQELQELRSCKLAA